MKKTKARAVLIDGKAYRNKADGTLVPLKGKTDWKRLERQTSAQVEDIAARDREGAPMSLRMGAGAKSEISPLALTSP